MESCHAVSRYNSERENTSGDNLISYSLPICSSLQLDQPQFNHSAGNQLQLINSRVYQPENHPRGPQTYQPPVVFSSIQASQVIYPQVYQSHVINSQVYQPQVINPQLYRPQGINPQVYRPHVINPQVYQPHVINPQVYRPHVINPQAYQPHETNPQLFQHQVGNPQAYQSQLINPQVYQPQVVNSTIYRPQSINPQVYQPQAAGSPIYQPKGVNSSLYKPQEVNLQVYQPQVVDSPNYSQLNQKQSINTQVSQSHLINPQLIPQPYLINSADHHSESQLINSPVHQQHLINPPDNQVLSINLPGDQPLGSGPSIYQPSSTLSPGYQPLSPNLSGNACGQFDITKEIRMDTNEGESLVAANDEYNKEQSMSSEHIENIFKSEEVYHYEPSSDEEEENKGLEIEDLAKKAEEKESEHFENSENGDFDLMSEQTAEEAEETSKAQVLESREKELLNIDDLLDDDDDVRDPDYNEEPEEDDDDDPDFQVKTTRGGRVVKKVNYKEKEISESHDKDDSSCDTKNITKSRDKEDSSRDTRRISTTDDKTRMPIKRIIIPPGTKETPKRIIVGEKTKTPIRTIIVQPAEKKKMYKTIKVPVENKRAQTTRIIKTPTSTTVSIKPESRSWSGGLPPHKLPLNPNKIIYKDLHSLYLKVKNTPVYEERLNGIGKFLKTDLDDAVKKIKYFNSLSLPHLQLYFSIINCLDFAKPPADLESFAPLSNIGLRKDLFLNLSSILEKDGDLAVTIVAELGDKQYQEFCSVLNCTDPIIRKKVPEMVISYHQIRSMIVSDLKSKLSELKETVTTLKLMSPLVEKMNKFLNLETGQQTIQLEQNQFCLDFIGDLSLLLAEKGISFYPEHPFFTKKHGTNSEHTPTSGTKVPTTTAAAEATHSRIIQIQPVETEEDVDNPDAVDPTQYNSDPLNIEITPKTLVNDSRNCGTSLGRSKIIEEVVNISEEDSSGDLDYDQEENNEVEMFDSYVSEGDDDPIRPDTPEPGDDKDHDEDHDDVEMFDSTVNEEDDTPEPGDDNSVKMISGRDQVEDNNVDDMFEVHNDDPEPESDPLGFDPDLELEQKTNTSEVKFEERNILPENEVSATSPRKSIRNRGVFVSYAEMESSETTREQFPAFQTKGRSSISQPLKVEDSLDNIDYDEVIQVDDNDISFNETQTRKPGPGSQRSPRSGKINLLICDLSALQFTIPDNILNRLMKSKYFLEKPGQYKMLQPGTAYKFTNIDPTLPKGFTLWARTRTNKRHIDREYLTPDGRIRFRSKTACIEYIKLLDNLELPENPQAVEALLSGRSSSPEETLAKASTSRTSYQSELPKLGSKLKVMSGAKPANPGGLICKPLSALKDQEPLPEDQTSFIKNRFESHSNLLKTALAPDLYKLIGIQVGLLERDVLSKNEKLKLSLTLANITHHLDSNILAYLPLTNPSLEILKFRNLYKLANKTNPNDPDVRAVQDLLNVLNKNDLYVTQDIQKFLMIYHRLRSRIFTPILERIELLKAEFCNPNHIHIFYVPKELRAHEYLWSLSPLLKHDLLMKLEEKYDFEFLYLLEKKMPQAPVQCPESQVQCSVTPAQCPVISVQRSVTPVQFPVTTVQVPLATIQYPVTTVPNPEASVKTFGCPSCLVPCENLTALVHHFALKHFHKRFLKVVSSTNCGLCDASFAVKKDVFKHLALIHGRITIDYVVWSCNLCSFRHKERQSLINHFTDKHALQMSEISSQLKPVTLNHLPCHVSGCAQLHNFQDMKSHVFSAHAQDQITSASRVLIEQSKNLKECIYCSSSFVSGTKIQDDSFITYHYAIQHNMILNYMGLNKECSLRVVFNKDIPSGKPSPTLVNLVDDENDKSPIAENSLTEMNHGHGRGINSRAASQVNLMNHSQGRSKQDGENTLEYCSICKKYLLKKNFLQHVVITHHANKFAKELKENGCKPTDKECSLCKAKFSCGLEFQTHFALTHSSKFANFQALSEDIKKEMVEHQTSEDLDQILRQPRSENDDLLEIIDTKPTILQETHWVQEFKSFCQGKAVGSDNMNFTIINQVMLESFLEKVTTIPENIPKVDIIVNELEAISSISLAKLETVTRHSLLKDYMEKCFQVSSTIYNIPPMQVVIFLSQLMVKPNVGNDDIFWLMKRINAIHDLVDGSPIGMDKKIFDFFKAIGFSSSYEMFKMIMQKSVPKPASDTSCDECNRQFATMKALKIHKFRQHSSPGNKSIPSVARTNGLSKKSISSVATPGSSKKAIPIVASTHGSSKKAIPSVSSTHGSSKKAIPSVSSTPGSSKKAIPSVSSRTGSSKKASPSVPCSPNTAKLSTNRLFGGYYECSVCGACYNNKNSLDRHEETFYHRFADKYRAFAEFEGFAGLSEGDGIEAEYTHFCENCEDCEDGCIHIAHPVYPVNRDKHTASTGHTKYREIKDKMHLFLKNVSYPPQTHSQLLKDQHSSPSQVKEQPVLRLGVLVNETLEEETVEDEEEKEEKEEEEEEDEEDLRKRKKIKLSESPSEILKRLEAGLRDSVYFQTYPKECSKWKKNRSFLPDPDLPCGWRSSTGDTRVFLSPEGFGIRSVWGIERYLMILGATSADIEQVRRYRRKIIH